MAVKAGDRLNISATYDTRKASWYESMGIMVLFVADGKRPGAKDPFKSKIARRALLTHGHLRENDNHGGEPQRKFPTHGCCPTGRSAPTSPSRASSTSAATSTRGQAGRPPVVRAGKSITFTNLDATTAISDRDSAYHTITACKAPCTRRTGIAYPLADAKVQFDSGELGYGPPGFTPAANRNTWKTPKSLNAGHLHLLLPDPPVHAGRVPGGGQQQEEGLSRSP